MAIQQSRFYLARTGVAPPYARRLSLYASMATRTAGTIPTRSEHSDVPLSHEVRAQV